MRLIGLPLIALIATTASYGEVTSWERLFYKVDTPNELVVANSVDGCPVSNDRLGEIIDDVLVFHQIESKSVLSGWDLFLAVKLICKEAKRDEYIFNLMVRFGRPYEDTVAVHLVSEYGDFGVGRKREMEDSVRASVQSAVAEYEEVNLEGLLNSQLGSRDVETDKKIDEVWEALEAIRTKHKDNHLVEWVKLSSWTSTEGDVGGVIVGGEGTGTQLFISRNRGPNEYGQLTGYTISIFEPNSGINELWNTGTSTDSEANLKELVQEFEGYLESVLTLYR